MNVKILRVSIKKTQRELAELLNISIQSYWKKENNVVPFTDLEKKKLKIYFNDYFEGITIDEIFFSDDALKFQFK